MKLNKLLIAAFFLIFANIVHGQNVGIGNIDPQSTLDIEGDLSLRSVTNTIMVGVDYAYDVNTIKSSNYKLVGFNANFALGGITPGVEGRQITLRNATSFSMELYNEQLLADSEKRISTGINNTLAIYPGGSVKLVYDSTVQRWVVISAHNYNLNYYGSTDAWSLNGNLGTTSENYLGTNDEQALQFRVNNVKSGIIDSIKANTAFGYSSFKNNTTGSNNVGIGKYALLNNISGNENVAIGSKALQQSNSSRNTAVGFESVSVNNQSNNTGIGYQALKNTYSENNTGVGAYALSSGGYRCTAIGVGALNFATSVDNVAIGMNSLYNNASTGNTACGTFSLVNNSTGQNNTAVGYFSMSSGTTGSNNIGIGYKSLYNINGGNFNIGIGYEVNLTNTTGSWNTVIGEHANTSINNLTGVSAIGASTIATTSNKVWLGANIAGMEIQAYGPYTNLSDGRFKENIKENIPGLSFITKLRPVSYTFNLDKLQKHITSKMQDSIAEHYYPNKFEIEKANQEIRTGFVAQEVDSLLQTLNYKFDGLSSPENETDTYRVSYAQFVVPLVKAVQEQQVIIDALIKRIEKLENK